MPGRVRTPRDERGHRTLPHTADLVIEAWAPTREGCFEEAVAALVDTFSDAASFPPTDWLPFELGPAPDDELVVLLLEEVIFVVEVRGQVPCACRVDDATDARLRGTLGLVSVHGVQTTGAAAKAVSYGDLSFAREGPSWVTRATIDV